MVCWRRCLYYWSWNPHHLWEIKYFKLIVATTEALYINQMEIYVVKTITMWKPVTAAHIIDVCQYPTIIQQSASDYSNRLVYLILPWADHYRSGGTIQLRPTPGGKYPYFSGAFPGGGLSYLQRTISSGPWNVYAITALGGLQGCGPSTWKGG